MRILILSIVCVNLEDTVPVYTHFGPFVISGRQAAVTWTCAAGKLSEAGKVSLLSANFPVERLRAFGGLDFLFWHIVQDAVLKCSTVVFGLGRYTDPYRTLVNSNVKEGRRVGGNMQLNLRRKGKRRHRYRMLRCALHVKVALPLKPCSVGGSRKSLGFVMAQSAHAYISRMQLVGKKLRLKVDMR